MDNSSVNSFSLEAAAPSLHFLFSLRSHSCSNDRNERSCFDSFWLLFFRFSTSVFFTFSFYTWLNTLTLKFSLLSNVWVKTNIEAQWYVSCFCGCFSWNTSKFWLNKKLQFLNFKPYFVIIAKTSFIIFISNWTLQN